MAALLTLEDLVVNEEVLSAEVDAEAEEDKGINPMSQVESIKAQELALALDKSETEIRALRASGDDIHTSAAKLKTEDYSYENILDQAYLDEKTVEETAEIINNRNDKGQDMALSEYMLMQSLTLNDNDINPHAHRTLTNMETFNRLMQKEFEANDQSGFSKVLSFLDVNVLREITIGAIENLTLRSNREGVDIREAFVGLKPDEFETWAKEYIAERKSEGVFSDESIWNLYKTANDSTYLGDDPRAPLNFLFGAFDVATLGYIKGLRSTTEALKGTTTLARDTSGKLASLVKTRRPIDAVAVVKGEPEAGKALAKSVENVGVQVDEVLAGRALPEELDLAKGPSARPSGVTFRQGSRKTTLMEKLEEYNRKGSFGEYIPRAVIDEIARETAEKIAVSVNDVVVNTRRVIDEGSDDYKVIVRLGKDGSGAPFRRKSDAEAIAARDPSLSVVRREEGRGWFIETEKRVDVLGLPSELPRFNKDGFVSDAINKVFGASSIRLGEKLGATFLQAEAGQALIGDLVKPYQKTIRAVKGKELENLSDFMTKLRDGDYSYYRQAPDRGSFEALYQHEYNKAPDKATVDAYEALMDINDTTWQIKSSDRLKKVVAEGGVLGQITDTFDAVVYRVDGQRIRVPENETILDVATGRSLTRDEVSANAAIFKVPDTFLDHLYVTNIKGTSVLERVDVMPYNVGGPRTNSEFRWFVGAVNNQRLASGNVIDTGFRTLLGSFGKQQAETAVSELNTIVKKAREFMDSQGVDTIADLKLPKKEFDEFGDLIRANNSWNKHVNDLDDLIKLSNDYGFKFRETFAFKARDEKVNLAEAGQDVASQGSTFGEVVGTRLNMKRGDTPLMEFGGKKAVNASPVTAISDQFGSEAFGYANRAATQNAIVGWVKLAETNPAIVTFPAGTPKSDFMTRFLNAEVTKSGKFNDLAAQLREQQDVIKRRINQPTLASEKWDVFTKSATEAIFEKTGKKLNFEGADPSSQLLKVGFYSKFGFFNPDQLVLQAFHSLTIAAISPISGSKALILAAPLRILTSPRLSEAAKKLAAERLVKTGLIDKEDLDGLLTYIKESGRDIIDTQIIELQAPQKFGSSSTFVGKAKETAGTFLDKSTIFFKEGESITRMTAIATAYLEHKAKRPNINPLSPEGRRLITNREQDLSFRMTTGSRSYIQSGFMRVPTQWLTFSFRALENIVVGRNFTGRERRRMAFVMGPMFGLTGLGAGKMAGYFTEHMGLDPDDPETVKVFNRIKYGFVDAFLSTMIGTETAYATRVAPADQIFETFKKLFSEDFMTVVGGPSAEISGDLLTAATRGISSMFAGRTQMAREDLNQVLRNLSTYDKIVKIRELIETGNYRSKTRKLAVGGLDPIPSALAVGFGATPAPVQNYYDYSEMVFKENASTKDFEKRLRDKANYATRLMIEGDVDDFNKGAKLWEEINDELWASNLTNQLKVSIQRRIAQGESIPEIYKNALRLGLRYDAEILQQQM